MKKILSKLILITAIAVLFNSCAKDGATGPQGPQGAAGTNGTNGSANVSASTFTITSWAYNGSTYYQYYADLSVPAITSTVMSDGTVQVFQGDGTGNVWVSMPYTYNN